MPAARRCGRAWPAGRIKIQVFAAGELLPAFEGFEAVSNGAVELNHGVSCFWSGKAFEAQCFATVPLGMSFLGHREPARQSGGGGQVGEEVCRPLNVVPFAAGSGGVQMTGWFKREIKCLAGLKEEIGCIVQSPLSPPGCPPRSAG